jgi:hypothetical protein
MKYQRNLASRKVSISLFVIAMLQLFFTSSYLLPYQQAAEHSTSDSTRKLQGKLIEITQLPRFRVYSSFLFVGTGGCLSCLDVLSENIQASNTERKRKVCVIIIGADSTDIKAKNIIYRSLPSFASLSEQEAKRFGIKRDNGTFFMERIAVRRENKTGYSFLSRSSIETIAEFLLKD